MAILSETQALEKRRQLVELGYCVVPGVLRGELLEDYRKFTDDLFARRPIDQKYRYQGSDIHIGTTRLQKAGAHNLWLKDYDPIVDRLIDLPDAREACAAIGLEHQKPDDMIIVLSKPPHGPPLYWHQDLMTWNHPEAASPWPTRIFLSYYLTDTTKENGCLRVIPGTHRKRIELHNMLPAAHGPDIQAVSDLSHPAFIDHPDAIDLPVKAGDLVINDARVLHAARGNTTDQRRTLVLQWHHVFDFPNPPSWWTGEVPEVIREYDPTVQYEMTRTPGVHLK